MTFDARGIVTGWSEGATRILGWTEQEMLGQSLVRLFPDEDGGRALLEAEMEEAVSKGVGGATGWRVCKDGRLIWALGETKPLFPEDPASGFVKVLRDETRQKELETTLQERTRALEIMNGVGAALARDADLASVIQTVTDAGVKLAGAEFGAFFYNIVDEQGESYTLYTISGVPRETFSKFPMPRNTAIFAPTFNGEGIVRSDDITKDPRYGRNLPHHGMPKGHLPVRSYLAVPVMSRRDGVLGGLFFGHSSPGRFSQDSEQMLTGLAAEAAVAIDNMRLAEAARRELEERRRAEAALRELNADLEDQVRRRTEELLEKAESLRQAQKMEAVGQLTGGIAHDFNNFLQIIVGNLDLLSLILPEEMPRQRRAAAMAMGGARRAASLTQKLLAFARRQPLDPKPLDINAVVQGMSELLRRALGETVELQTDLAADVWRSEVDPSELESTIVNLAVNARDAMPGGGRLRIGTANAHLTDKDVAAFGSLAPGEYVLVTVTDTGAGMDASTLARAFEPFFTTKEDGRGTGLGLSQVYGFVKQSNGHVELNSEPGRGTTVRLYLPRHSGYHPTQSESGEIMGLDAVTGETILVVEDDADVRQYAVSALQALGYHVVDAKDGAMAIRILKEMPIDMVFSDLVLPGGMTGEQVVAQAKQLQPRVKCLFTTGYARNTNVQQGRHDRDMPILAKPFALDALAAKVREVLDR